MLELFLDNHTVLSLVRGLGLPLTFFVTILMLLLFRGKMPADQGRKFAVDGSLSKGKVRGVGLIFVLVYAVMTLLIVRPTVELMLYLALVILSMLTGFLDDASDKPWNEYKKGVLDFLIAAGIAVTYIFFNVEKTDGHIVGVAVSMGIFGISFLMPVWLYAILAIILIWVSINVTNCTDGVDGLSSTVGIITLLSFYFYMKSTVETDSDFYYSVILFVMTLLAYLLFNATPSLMLMGDAGSRAMGTLVAIAAMKCADPFLFIPFALVFILDGGLGLIKLSLKRFLKISILKNTRTPLHDHARKNKNWSNTQVVFRFAIIQIIISATILFCIRY